MITALSFDTTKTGAVVARSELLLQENRERFQSGELVPTLILGEMEEL
jgi:hypothetical protein